MRRPIMIRTETNIAVFVFPFVIEAQRLAPGFRCCSLNQSFGPSRRTASIRIDAAPLPWFLTGGSTVKPASQMIFVPLAGDVVLVHAIVRQIQDGLLVAILAQPVDVMREHLADAS
jgi:hypothetical protein